MAIEAVSEAAPAKLNLCLHVTGRRVDGYHLLDSLVVFADIADRVFASPARGLSLVVAGPEGAGLRADDDNLVLRAARCMGITDAALVLDKQLPIASGVGGGSADAAATLRALVRLTGRPLPDLPEVLRLGADVPVCLASRPARMTGIGDHLAPLPPLPSMGCLLVNPRLPVPTPQVFAALDRHGNGPLPDLPETALASAATFADWLAANSRNDLVRPARTVAPVLADVQAALDSTPGCLFSRMSGSGGTHFGLFATPESAAAAATHIREAHPYWWTAAGRILD
ncbi:4-(cytidine 5'-diphospho)-2-C-methyl-D-erythritol kinase [Rhodobacter calidifons]|uniref:4-diphosphocytidyl-2-C-methyl-D-erythritol kinase n=1 Tax=Rhodobacter calidifons TaxID=2715277 RepID=A0ABX0G5T6_9RHOB|nr:4-(cytidine 5'-diphospho)-2-C-methyl-D-erythritol kinase [Rhodobacter calidifons]NHB76637.1 4-(cytidine 5'-diphospho)-2-C-methyl-D-erythritol kinase [Rhodobacter calidifons]